MANATDYLELWRRRYSFPNYITGHEYLTESGSAVSDTDKSWSAAQQLLLNGNAIGTADGHYLNPIPLFNRLDHIYSDIVKKGFISARSDAIKMNVKNMDYTNGSSDTIKMAPKYPFFNFYGYDLDDVENKTFYSGKEGINATYMTQFFVLFEQYCDGLVNKILTYTIPKSYAEKTKTQTNKTVLSEIERFNGIYELWNESEELEVISERFNKTKTALWNRYNIVDDASGAVVTYYGPANEMIMLYIQYCNYLSETFFGLQLLMPQYKRRVEVEDLNKNFWVISTILDVVVNALWGPYGLIDVVRQLIAKVIQIEDFLGLSSLTGIELLYNGDNELYFDMYSRFLLSGLELKLKTQSGERVIKNIFKAHSEFVDRDSTTDYYGTRDELFEAIQFKEITPTQSGYKSTGLYDSDLICSDEKVALNNNTGYLSLSSVIDAINDAIVNDKTNFGSVYYNISPAYKKFFGLLDITPDGTLSPTDYERIALDSNDVTNGATLTPEQIKRFNKYTQAKEYLEGLVNKTGKESDEIELLKNLKIESIDDVGKYFTSKQILLDTSIDSIDLDGNGTINEEEYLKYANNQIKQIKNYLNNLLHTCGSSKTVETLSENPEILTSPIDLTKSDYVDGLRSSIETEQELSKYLNYYCTHNKNIKDIYISIKILPDQQQIKIMKTNDISKLTEYDYKIAIHEFDTILILPSEDVYSYSLYGCIIIAKKILPNKNPIKEWFDDHGALGSEFFNIDGIINEEEGPIDLYDAVEVAKSLLPTYYNAEYFNKIRNLMFRIDSDDGLSEEKACVSALADLVNRSRNNNNQLKTDVVNQSIKNQIKEYLFVKKYDGDPKLVKMVSEISCPNLYMLIEIAKMAQPIRERKGYEITNANRQGIINTITETNYQLHDNILIFLYDEDYYNIQDEIQSGTSVNSGEAGLYVSVTDGFYQTTQPVIPYKLKNKKSTTHLLFVPRSDLIGGEIIELRLTEKNINKEILDLSNLTKDGFTQMKETKSRLFLSLHNSFADIPSQYNHRTTLFFKDTVPEDVSNLGNNENPFKDINSWFCNGIECQYFKPTTKKVGEDTELSTKQTKLVDLKIKASMICKAENINDNSFIFEEGPTESVHNSETFYSFARKMAFGAAQRHNLVFYSSPATQDGDMFVHSPSQLLLSPSLRGDESIQAPYWMGDLNYEGKMSAYDVMSEKGKTCKLADITNMLYKNSLIKENKPLVIDAIWGMRNVDNYIKPKKIKYIIIEREPGSRNNTYGPTSIGFSHSKGYLHSGDGLVSLGEFDHYTDNLQVKWYSSEGKYLNNNNKNNGYFPPAKAKYGVIDLTKISNPNGSAAIEFAQTFMIRFYSSNSKSADRGTHKEYIYNENNNKIYRKPIFKMAYFLGEDMLETDFKKSSFSGDK
ncbi:MAG: hypothetical protein ACI4VU_00990 [Methanobrevibacter sp.]